MSTQQPVEMVLLRQLASYLTIPIWMMDDSGNLLYYNVAAEQSLGARFNDVGPIHAEQLADLFKTSAIDEPGDDMPVVRTLQTRQPAHGRIRFCSLDGVWRDVEITAIPIEGLANRFLGAMALFWDSPT